MFRRRDLLLAAPAALAGCKFKPQPLEPITAEFAYTSLSFSPTASTATGLHRWASLPLDEQLDDFTEGNLNRQREWFRGFREGLLKDADRERLVPEDQADYDLITQQLDLGELEINEIRSYKKNPTLYVEMIGSGLFAPFSLNYDKPEHRWYHIVRRLEQVPLVCDVARKNLEKAPEVWSRVAREESAGNRALIEGPLRSGCPQSLRPSFDKAAQAALLSLEDFERWLESLPTQGADWRLGPDLYGRKFRLELGGSLSSDGVLAEAEADLERFRAEMAKLAGGDVRAALDRIAARHATRDSYFEDARRDLAEATEFVRRKDLLTLPGTGNLQVIETPEFMRGIYGVGGFSPAPALAPELGAYYWLTPIPAAWPAARVDSKLREYNYYGLKLLTIHEAMPGHYVQFEYANRIEPRPRRLLRSLYGSGAYVEGWAVWSTEQMLEQGYLDGDPNLRMTFLKQQLRMIANTILDIRLHSKGMTDAEAMDLMVNRTFQEKEEATAKLQRAQLSVCQLPEYYVGWKEWTRMRAQFVNFPFKRFAESALRVGALPVEGVSRLLAAGALKS
jgi:hypothetical protein